MKDDKGTYQVRIGVRKRTGIDIGSLGTVDFQPGIYVYTGRAKQGLRSRLLRHRRKNKPRHWHIDFLTCHPEVEILKIARVSSDPDDECRENRKFVTNQNGLLWARGFGSTDCKSGCGSHLVKVN